MRWKLTAGLLVFIVLQSLACSLTAEGGKICIVVATETPGSQGPPDRPPPEPPPPGTPLPPPDSCTDTVPASDAAFCTGEVATVCGTIADTSYRDDIGWFLHLTESNSGCIIPPLSDVHRRPDCPSRLQLP